MSAETYRFHEFDIPVDLLNLTGGGIDTFDVIAAAHMTGLSQFIGISPNHSILEIGCGIGRESGQEAIREYLQTKTVWIDLLGQTANPFVIR